MGFWEAECVEVTAPNQSLLNRAKQAISDVIGSQCRIGDIVTAKIINIQSYGIMIQIEDGSEHLVHISQWDQNEHCHYSTNQEVEIMCIGFLGENRPNFSRKAAIWQLSDDPEDRARLRLMLDSLRPPARSRAHAGSQTTVSPSNMSTNNEESALNFMQHREPLSIFSDDQNDDSGDYQMMQKEVDKVDDDGINLSRKLMMDSDEAMDDDDDDTTHPIILPPPPNPNKLENNKNNKESIKNLIDSISNGSNKESVNGQSRFANLYKDIHSEQDAVENKTGSKFGDLMNSIRSTKNPSINNHEKENSKETKVESIENWKSFTKDLMGSSNQSNGKNNANDNDDLLNDLFGDKQESINNEKTSSRASALMDSMPDFMEKSNEESDKWPWQQDAI